MIETLQQVNVFSCFLRVCLALFFGGLLGMERGKKRRPAGLRTYMLVCVGSALVMITNQYMVELYPGIDPSRMSAQVISGIGFLGAGTIIITGKNRVKGLTTAAGLWAVACLGITIGIGFYYGAIIGGICIFIIMEVMHNFDDKMISEAKVINVYVEFIEMSSMGKFMEYIKECGMSISDLELVRPEMINDEGTAGIFTLRLPEKILHEKVIEIVTKSNGVVFAEEV